MAAGGENLPKYSTEFPRVQSVPIDSRQEDPYNAGEIQYMYREASDPAGVYSLVFYWHGCNWPEFTKYLKGLHFYRRLVHDERFPGWKLVVYTDTKTLGNLEYTDTDSPEIVNQKKMINSVLNDPKLILALVTWPEYAPFQTVENTNLCPWTRKVRANQKIFARNAPELSTMIHGPVFRCFRYHAFHYFPDIPVYVRDADTTFFWSSNLNAETLDKEFTKESQWEAAFFKYFTEFNRGNGNKYPMLLGTQVEYSRKWHKNARLPLIPGGKNFYGYTLPSYREGGMFGIYAGMMAYNGGIDEWKSPMLWHSSLDYIRGVCKILPNTGFSSNMGTDEFIGKDEQIPLFVWLPVLYSRTYFFLYEYIMNAGQQFLFWDTWGGITKEAYKYTARKYAKFLKPEKTGVATYRFKVNDDFFVSPKTKISDMDKIYLIANPKSFDEYKAAQREQLSKWVDDGITDADDPILNYTLSATNPKLFESFPINHGAIEKIKYDVFNPYTVLELFRNPIYHEFISFIFKVYVENYVAVCERHGHPTNYISRGLHEQFQRELAELPPFPTLPEPTPEEKAEQARQFAEMMARSMPAQAVQASGQPPPGARLGALSPPNTHTGGRRKKTRKVKQRRKKTRRSLRKR